MTGRDIVTLPRFEFEPFLEALQDSQVTYAPLVPPIIIALAKHPAVENYDLSHLTTVGSGAAPLGKDLEEACRGRIGCTVGQGYGMTETSCGSHVSPPEGVKAGSVGVPLPNTECKVVDLATGAELGPNEQGEVCPRGPRL